MKTLLPKEVGKCLRLCPWVCGLSSWATLISLPAQSSCNSRAAKPSTQNFYCCVGGENAEGSEDLEERSEMFPLLLPFLHELASRPLQCLHFRLTPSMSSSAFPSLAYSAQVCLSHLLENMSSSFLMFSSLPPPSILTASHDKLQPSFQLYSCNNCCPPTSQ